MLNLNQGQLYETCRSIEKIKKPSRELKEAYDKLLTALGSTLTA